MKIVENLRTEQGAELGRHLARFAEVEIEKTGVDNRCETCAFRRGDHLANGSPETLMTALKCVMERTPFFATTKMCPALAGFCLGQIRIRQPKCRGRL